MERRWIVGAAWALGGLLVAQMLTFGAFALAGQELSEPASVPVLSMTPSPVGNVGETPSPSPTQSPDETGSPSPGAGDDDGSDDGQGTNDDHGDDNSNSDDHSGSGSGDDDHDDD
jgi:hypothetical protein